MKTHLVLKRNKTSQLYLYRSRIPLDLVERFGGRREFQISLKNGNVGQSYQLSLELHQTVQHLYSDIRLGMKTLTLDDVKTILKDKVDRTILHSRHTELETFSFLESELQRSLKRIEEEETKLRTRLETDLGEVVSHIDGEVERLLKSQDFKVDTNSIEFKTLRKRFIELRLMRTKWKVDLLKGSGEEDDFRREVEESFKMRLYPEPGSPSWSSSNQEMGVIHPTETVQTQVMGLTKLQSKPISDVRDEYLDEKGNITDKTRREFRSGVNLTIDCFGDIPIGTITREMGKQFKDGLRKLPPNWKKNPKYRTKTFRELVTMNVKERISDTTVNHILTIVSSWMEWSKNNHYVNENVFKGMKLKIQRRPRDERDRFTEGDLKGIFSRSFIFETVEKRKFHYYWIPLIGVFTGMRLNEICSLYLDNVYQMEGNQRKKRWVIDIREEHDRPDKHLKNLSSRRIIPIHDTILELGFLDYLKRLKDIYRKRERIFEELPLSEGNYGKNVSRFFNQEYLHRIGIKTDKKSFHSLRHTVSDHLKQKGIDPHFINEFLGHSTGNIDLERYGDGYNPDILYNKVVSKIRYETSSKRTIDFLRLKVDWKKVL